MQVDPKFRYPVSQIFSPTLLNKFNESKYEISVKKLLLAAKIYSSEVKWNFIEGLSSAYTYLKSEYRCEYVYMNEIANQLLLKFHDDNSATFLKELFSDKSIADIVIINGNTVAYEIKTELDNFERLAGQIDSYLNLYDKTYLVTHKEALKPTLLRIPGEIGVIIFEEDGKLTTVKEAACCVNRFDPKKAVFTLRQSELNKAYKKYEGCLPVMGTAVVHSYLIEWFTGLDQGSAHTIFAESLKSRKPSDLQFDLIKSSPFGLKLLFLGKNLSKKDCNITMERIGIT